ncbi:type 1 glutamine amidotransferase [Nocardioides aurantiacus]|uniref:type 1 glutamine amidotransferase n=1 Tax=Nocardioides aurantiacus TaxID=86796 RepID=UPI00403FA0BC
MGSILIIQPDAEDPPEKFARWLRDEGFHIRLLRPYEGDPVPERLEDDALIVLGGDMSANDTHEYPWLANIMELLRHTVTVGAPALGICLGGQLLAAAFGGKVEPGPYGMEAGVVVVHPRSGADSDALLSGLPWPLRMITLHRDAIAELPRSAMWLAESQPYGHQIFRVGQVAWGVQFHPEVSPGTYAAWATYIRDTGEALRRVRDGLSQVVEHDDETSMGAKALATAFAAVIRRYRASR